MHSFSSCLLLLINIFSLSSTPTSAVDFIYNGFHSSDLLLFGDSSVESNVISLTNGSTFSIGRVLYPTKIPTRAPNSSHLLPFSTSFIFSTAPLEDFSPGHGFVFLFTPSLGIQGTSSSQHLGLLNRTNNGDPSNHVFGVEFDVFENPEFSDINGNHVGVDVNSLTSLTSHTAGYWHDADDDESLVELKLTSGDNYHVWIDYFNSQLNVTIAPVGITRPRNPLITVSLDLSEVLLDEMHVGFCASTGQLVENHRILGWSFSNSNASQSLSVSNLSSYAYVSTRRSIFRSKRFIVGFVLTIIFVVVCAIAIIFDVVRRKRRKAREEEEEMEEWELEYWPHRITYKDIYDATKGFSDDNVIGFGSHGKVYQGVMVGGAKIAVKCISHERKEALNEFLSEVSSLGRLRHRNLVVFRGWCKQENGGLILVYDMMENGSLDKMLFERKKSMFMSWEDRIRVLKDVGVGIMYLHEGWEASVLHRDIKSSNVLLDKDMNGRLGDLGLARILGKVDTSMRVIGTVGYMAPELVQSGRATVQTDVFSYGVLVLEVVCGRRPVENGRPHLVDWVWELVERGELMQALDEQLRAKDGLDYEEAKTVVGLGLLCTHPDPVERLTMRKAVTMLEETMDGRKLANGRRMDDHFEKIKSTKMWSSYRRRISSKHPTVEELRILLSSSMSLPESDIMTKGR